MSVATAQAQDANPHATVEEQATTSQIDTDYTPVAKEPKPGEELWTLLHGATYPKTEVVEGSLTRFDTDLHAVAFENRTIGLAGGSACAAEPVQERTEPNDEFGARVAECRGTDGVAIPRVPALYRYSEPPNQDPSWDRLELPKPISAQNQANAGYIGAIAWIDSQRALIVGGTGKYPRREPPADGKPSTDPDKADPAGKARAWLYTRATNTAKESIAELDLSALTPDTPASGGDPARAGMRGLSAVGCFRDPDPLPGEDKRELCFAGALGQLWEWRDEKFTGKRVDALSPDEEMKDARLFRYRVRDIAFTGQWPTYSTRPDGDRLILSDPTVAQVVTAGCCDADESKNTPRTLTYQEATFGAVVDTWYRAPGPPRWQVGADGKNIFVVGSDSAGPILGSASPEAENTHRDTNDHPELPDSYYAFGLRTAGGPLAPDEPPSVYQGQNVGSPFTVADTAALSFSTTRLLAREGGWLAGELRSTHRPGLGARGLIVAAGMARPAPQEGVNAGVMGGLIPTGFHPTPDEIAQGWQPFDQETLNASIRSRHYFLPSYAANAIEIVDGGADGWMVGDHGAILRLSEAGRTAAGGSIEPAPPRLGAPRNRPLSDRSAYEDSRPELPENAGIVPALGGETVALDEPQMLPSGASGISGTPISQIVISRDGSEGWAIAGNRFSHFDGTSWSECDPLGVEGQAAPDPACEEMAPLRGYRDKNGVLKTATLTYMARVPLENDDDPTNDDELEIVAIGTTFCTCPAYKGEQHYPSVRYADGRWRFEEPEAVKPLDETVNTSGNTAGGKTAAIMAMAFTSSDEGWLVTSYGSGLGARLYRFNGERWADCHLEPEPCGDSGQFPETSRGIVGLTAAGDRVYVYGRRLGGDCGSLAGGNTCAGRWAPMILYHDRGGEWTDGSQEGADDAGFDPAFSNPGTAEPGRVDSLAVVEGPDGFEGWAVGEFGGGGVEAGNTENAHLPPDTVLMRLAPSAGEGWRRFRSPGSLEDYMLPTLFRRGSRPPLAATYPAAAHPDGAFVAYARAAEAGRADSAGSRVFGLDAERERFRMLDSGRPQEGTGNLHLFAAGPDGQIQALAPDGQGGFWASIGNYLFHHTDVAPKPVFEETANPLGRRGARLTALTGASDGAVWAATDSDRVFRYDRVAGWEETRIGWDPGRVVTRTSQAAAIAIGPNGEGLVVGEGGRIADLSPTGAILDAAAGRSCALDDDPPCATGYDLTAVDLAPDGSAIAAGERLAILWRSAGGEFRAATAPPIGSSTTIAGVSTPTPTRAYLATDRGVVFRGDLSGESWTWQAENVTSDGETISVGALDDIAVDAQGHGYAVGPGGMLERTPEGAWRVLPRRYGGASEVELPEAGGEGVLIGDARGRILTGSGSELAVARQGEFSGSSGASPGVVGFAYLPGSAAGSVDAWAGLAPRGSGDSRLLRHRSDPDDSLLDPARAAAALPDAPAQREGELSLAAFGKSDCDNPEDALCPEMTATTTTNELVLERIVDELAGLRENGELDLALGSGDAADSAGLPGSSLGDLDRVGNVSLQLLPNHTQLAGQLKHRLYAELVADELADRGVSLLSAIGAQDLTETYACEANHSCETTKELANAGENLAWREAFAGRAEPWGDGSAAVDAGEGEIQLEPAPGSEDNSLRVEDQRADADGEGAAPEAKAAIGGANTHYAIDATRDGEAIARIVFVDTSLRSLQASDPLQQPHELAGGQQRFLERMICRQGDATTTAIDECTRGPDQKAIVVSNTPTYSYGPGALTHTALDATTFEATMLRYDVDLVISGALGYNGLYYTLAPGVHEPCPAGAYPESPPRGSTPECLAGPTAPAEAAQERLRESPAGEAAPADAPDPATLVSEQGLAGAYPTLIAAGAGGKFGPDGNEPPDGPAGQWHGYSLARLLPNGDLVVEQRPILDWIGLDAPDHAVAPKSRLRLNGYGRSPISTGIEGGNRAFHYEISSAAITHRYDLALADPERPWLPCRADDPGCVELQANLSRAPGSEGSSQADAATASDPTASALPSGAESPCSPYLCLPSRIGSVDDQSGQVRAGDGKYPETFAIAMLSVDEELATYPLVFKRSPSFVTSPALRTAGLPQTSGARTPAPPPPPPPPGLPQIPKVEIPQIPPPPAIPQLTAATPPEPQPPAPPAPPPPSQQPSALDLSVAPPGVSISTPTALIQPPTPPVNPAPPGGARREARQRQAAAQKGGADSGEEGKDAGDAQGRIDSGEGQNLSMSRNESAATRRERTRHAPSFTALARAEQPSAWARGALYGGGMTLAAAALALAFTTLRPGSRRRQPEVPAPAQARNLRP